MSTDIAALCKRLRAEYTRRGAYAPTATCCHGIHPYECRKGCAPPTFEAADALEALQARVEQLEETLKGLVELSPLPAEYINASEWRCGGNDMASGVAKTARRALDGVPTSLPFP